MKTTAITVLQTMRPNFLLLTLSVVTLGSALAIYDGATWSSSLFALILLTGLAGHALVNMLNEYQDFHSGLDAMTERTPFSGGSGALIVNPSAVAAVKVSLILLVIGIGVLGSYLVYQQGLWLLFWGLIGLALALFYTSHITRWPWLCLVAPGAAFGPIMVLGTYGVWSGELTWQACLVSMVPFFLVNNLLLLNQFPDLEADRKVGRENVIIRYGQAFSAGLFILMALAALAASATVVAVGKLPPQTLIGFVLLPLFIKMLMIVWQQSGDMTQNIDKLLPALAMNVIINLSMPLLISAGLLWAIWTA